MLFRSHAQANEHSESQHDIHEASQPVLEHTPQRAKVSSCGSALGPPSATGRRAQSRAAKFPQQKLSEDTENCVVANSSVTICPSSEAWWCPLLCTHLYLFLQDGSCPKCTLSDDEAPGQAFCGPSGIESIRIHSTRNESPHIAAPSPITSGSLLALRRTRIHSGGVLLSSHRAPSHPPLNVN